jgi:hypothetical protein
MWIYVPPTLASAPASAGSILPSRWFFRTLSRSCTWRTKSLPPKGWWRLFKRGVFDKLPCGRTSQRSMAADCEAWWTQSLPDFPASPTRLLESDQATMTSEPSGLRLSASLSKSDLLWCSSKTSQSLFGTLPLSSGNWRLWATWLRRQHSLRRKRLGRAIEGKEYSCWPTATAHDDGKSPGAHLRMKQRMGERDGTFANRTAITSLAVKVQTWPTPRAEDAESAGNHPGATDSLTGAAKEWPTPSARDWKSGEASQETMDRNARPLNEVATLWTTPQAHDTAPGDPNRVNRYGTKHGARNLTDDVTLWSTPNTPSGGRTLPAEHVQSRGQTEKGKRQVGLEMEARYWRTPSAGHADKGASQSPEKRLAGGHTVDLQDQAEWNSFLPAQPTVSDGPQSSANGPTSRPRLNPMFVSWLMGFPAGWIGCDASGIPLYLSRLRERLWN